MSSGGISISQSGVPLRRAADYQKTLDSRWRFLEVEKNVTVEFTIPFIAPVANPSSPYDFSQKVKVLDHNLGFYPFFSQSLQLIGGTPLTGQGYGQVFADKKSLYVFPSYEYTRGQAPLKVRAMLRIYNIDIEQEYTAPTLNIAASSSMNNNEYGVKFLDDSGRSNIFDDSSTGFSIDTTKKILSIQRITTKHITHTTPTVEHGAGYPPSYLVCRAPMQPFKDYYEGYNIPHRFDYFTGGETEIGMYSTADSRIMSFFGVQSVIDGVYTFIILKDPLDLSA